MAENIRELQSKLTRSIIENSFLSLLQNKEIEKITVADICRTANISRGTFYLHYRDVNDLIDYINSWYVNAVTPMICNSFTDVHGENSDLEYLSEIMSLLKSWPEYATIILGHERGQLVIDRVTEVTQEIFLEMIRKDPTIDEKDAMYRFAYSFYGGWGVIRKWCRDGLKESPEQLIKYMPRPL